MIVAVAAATALGAVLRYLLDRRITRARQGLPRMAGVPFAEFPMGTFVVNVLGAFVLGYVTARAAHGALGPTPFDLLGPGLCAGFTTFSTWMLETVDSWRAQQKIVAVSNIGLTVVVGCAAAAGGLALG